MIYLAELSVCITVRFTIPSEFMLEVCPAYKDKKRINDPLVKLRSLIDQTCFEFIDVSYFGTVNFLPQKTPDAVFCQINLISVDCMLIKSL